MNNKNIKINKNINKNIKINNNININKNIKINKKKINKKKNNKKKNKKTNNINKIYIKLASPKYIFNKSYGEVLTPETINYKTKKPELNGLFCEKIFGPIKDYECSCGKYKNKIYKGIICDKCGIEITKKNVRRKRMGHIKLCVPIVHIWYFRCLPNKLSYLLNKSSKDIESIIYYDKYIVINIKNLKFKKNNGRYLKKLDLINEEEYFKIKQYIYKNKSKKKYKFIAKTGGEAIKSLLKKININKTFSIFKNKFYNEKNKIKKNKLLKILKIIELFHKGKNKNLPKYMIIKNLPIIPPDLRPIITLEEGKYASSDLNEFYRKIIIRNNRLKKLISINAPNIILKNEKRILQESIDSLLDNSRKLYAVKSESNRSLKSLSDILKGKQGRFRQNLLGKRVDYSARSVIVVDPKLKLYECGLPKNIALELYKPFLINKLINKGIINSISLAKKYIKNKNPLICKILKKVIKGHPILLNRAPTLHRLSIQAFQPILINGKAIKLHPLVCGAFNADFDGDQMAIHLPLSTESILEAQLLMLSPINIINIANGSPIIIPSQEIILGLYYLTKRINTNKNKFKLFSSYNEIIIAHNLKKLDLHENIKFKYNNEFIFTTVGRVLFNKIIPNKKKVGFINLLINNKTIKDLINKVFYSNNIFVTSNFLDKLKDLGLKYSFKSGTSFNLNDIITPKEKKTIIYKTIKKINYIIKNYNMGLISNYEKSNKIINEWSNTNSKLSNKVINNIKNKNNGLNNLYMMLDSGARSSIEQIRQLSGMRGLMTKPQKYNLDYTKIIEFPIISNFYEGLSILEYFLSTHGSRKGLADTALKTADAGYLTRRLVDVVQDVIIKEKDCKTFKGININNNQITDTEILGKVVLYNISFNNKIIIKKGEIINFNHLNSIKKSYIKYISVRSPLTCETKYGICAKCYGSNLSNGKLINVGETIGVIAAQSIGEPGTQLTLRTFHVGGSTSTSIKTTKFKSKYKGIILLNSLKYIKKKNKYIVISKYTNIKIIDLNNKNILYNNYIPYGCTLYFKNNDLVNIGDIIYKINPYYSLLISEYNGIVKYNNIIKNITYKSNNGEKIIIESKNINPTLLILDKKGKLLNNYNLSIGSYLNVKNNEKIKKGKILIKIPRVYYNYKDITGGLPKLSELFEARNPINKAIISEIDGIVSNIIYKKNYVKIYITNNFNKNKIYTIKNNKKIIVQKNDIIKHGDKLTEGKISLNDILNINGINYIQNYLINNLQNIYKSQGVQINNKHFEIIINQMLKKVIITDSGDTNLIKGNIINKEEFFKINKKIKKFVKITKSNYKKYYIGKITNKNKIFLYNEYLNFYKKKLIKTKPILPAIGKPILLGITKSSLHTKSFISAASFQETTKILSEAAISAKTDYLKGLKENIIIGKKIPAGTGFYKNEIK
ncbi:DNA-directed RNA polymerase subunit beta' [Candidatus Shikimatogenerans bostrichidophilus]|uniref:DNA-directed RNA polymerase subunit beta' n=1 Tax=Candidatus Shikimatogenerans bostrichidophilus TaxID=2943807 RepID=UPI0029663036